MLMNKAYNVDCVKYMRDIPDNFFDLAVCDPPYGIGESGAHNKSRSKLATAQDYKPFAGNDSTPPMENISKSFSGCRKTKSFSEQITLSAGCRSIATAGLCGTRKTAKAISRTASWHGLLLRAQSGYSVSAGRVCYRAIWSTRNNEYILRKSLLPCTAGFSRNTQSPDTRFWTRI